MIKTPPAPAGGVPHLAFGVVGPAGSWNVDDVDAQPGKLAELLPLKPTGELLQTDVLPDNWQPEGHLDAVESTTVKGIKGRQELRVGCGRKRQ